MPGLGLLKTRAVREWRRTIGPSIAGQRWRSMTPTAKERDSLLPPACCDLRRPRRGSDLRDPHYEPIVSLGPIFTRNAQGVATQLYLGPFQSRLRFRRSEESTGAHMQRERRGAGGQMSRSATATRCPTRTATGARTFARPIEACRPLLTARRVFAVFSAGFQGYSLFRRFLFSSVFTRDCASDAHARDREQHERGNFRGGLRVACETTFRPEREPRSLTIRASVCSRHKPRGMS